MPLEERLTTTTLSLSTPDGPLRVARVTPQYGAGPWPALVFCIDGVGLRSSLQGMAQRFADEANVIVFVPDFFFRSGDVLDMLPNDTPKTPASMWPLLADPEFRTKWRAKFFDVAVNVDTVKAVGDAVFAALDADRDVVKAGVGVTGYCMGGHISLKFAGLFADRVAAGASFHGGFLASDAPDSPHSFAPQMKARLYVAAASEDPSFPEPMKQKLVEAFAAANLEFVVETYPARHGWCVPDSPSFNEVEAAKAQKALTRLLMTTLKR